MSHIDGSWEAINRQNETKKTVGACGRVVKAMDLNSIGLCPHRFESCRLREIFFDVMFIKL